MVKVEVWSDIVCPFCYIGKRRLEKAAAVEGLQLNVLWRSFELNPNGPRQPEKSLTELLADKYDMTEDEAVLSQERVAQVAAEEGIDFQWRKAQPGNTFDAHRIAHYAQEKGKGGEMEERLFQAYMTQGLAVSDPDVLVRLGSDIGLDASEMRAVLRTDLYAQDVRRDEARGQMHYQVRSVPYFLIEGRYAVSGAQPLDVFQQGLRRAVAANDRKAEVAAAARAAGCSPQDGGCALPGE